MIFCTLATKLMKNVFFFLKNNVFILNEINRPSLVIPQLQMMMVFLRSHILLLLAAERMKKMGFSSVLINSQKKEYITGVVGVGGFMTTIFGLTCCWIFKPGFTMTTFCGWLTADGWDGIRCSCGVIETFDGVLKKKKSEEFSENSILSLIEIEFRLRMYWWEKIHKIKLTKCVE